MKASSGRRYFFEGTIQSDDGTSFTRKWFITTRKEGNEWRVSNFTESRAKSDSWLWRVSRVTNRN